MNCEQIRRVIDLYEKRLSPIATAQDMSARPSHMIDEAEAFGHCLDMIPQVRSFLHEGHTEKAMRWLGFIQGCLWMTGIYSIGELRTHNRS